MKKCLKCDSIQPFCNFYKQKSNKDGLQKICKSCFKHNTQLYYIENKNEHLKRTNSYFHSNKDKWKKYYADFRLNHPKTPPQKLHTAVFDGIRRGLKKLNTTKTHISLDVLGLENWDKFREYIESQFTEGMTWDNYGNKPNCWSIDHIIPISLANNIEEVNKLNHYTNLRPMWHIDNIKKRNKI